MRRIDFRACAISGATPAALEALERALAAFQSWRSGAERHLAPALQDAPAFVSRAAGVRTYPSPRRRAARPAPP